MFLRVKVNQWANGRYQDEKMTMGPMGPRHDCRLCHATRMERGGHLVGPYNDEIRIS